MRTRLTAAQLPPKMAHVGRTAGVVQKIRSTVPYVPAGLAPLTLRVPLVENDQLIQRRVFLQSSLAYVMTQPLRSAQESASERPSFDAAAESLEAAARGGTLSAAAMFVRHGSREQIWSFGAATSPDAVFLLASISKPMTAAAVMTLCDRGELRLSDPVGKYIPEFRGEMRRRMLVRHLLTHVSGLPDQLPENAELRRRHAPLSDFVAGAMRTPLRFQPGTKYSYSSMGILLAAEIAERLSGMSLRRLMAEKVFAPLGMWRSALGLGDWSVEQTMLCQVDRAAEESGAGDPRNRDWDWNSRYWRDLGSPWGGVHGTAGDVGRFFAEFLHPTGKLFSDPTAQMMIRNQHGPHLPPRGLGFGLGKGESSDACSERAFGHTGSTGTLAWADPVTDTVCVVLTTLPAEAATPHPRQMAADQVAQAVG